MGSGTVAVTGANSAVGKALLRQIAGQDTVGAGQEASRGGHEALPASREARRGGRGTLRAVAAVRRPAALESLPRSPHITPSVIDYDQPERLVAALGPADCVVHLAGVLFESRTSGYRAANVDTTRALVAAAQAAAVRHVVFVSSLGADPRSSNGYFRSKGEAERLVAGSGIDATIIRTPLLLGRDAAGGRALLRGAAGPSVRVLGGGSHRLRPLDVDDLCRAILACCRGPAGGVRTCELAGPTMLSQRELLQRTARLLGHDLSVGSTPVWLARLGARLAGLVRPGGLTPAVIDVITSDEAVRRNADGDLGISLTPLSDTLAKLCETRAS